jgi:hypothetical protein
MALVALGIVVLPFLAGAWLLLPPGLVIALIVLDVLFVAGGIYARVKYPQLGMEDETLRAYQREQFEGVEVDAAQSRTALPAPKLGNGAEDANLDALRVGEDGEYARNRGLFLVHTWKPSKKPGEVADIVIRLREHRDTSARPSVLAEDKIDAVRYELGRMFSNEPFVKRDKEDGFALSVSAYKPMLCVAEVTFRDGHDPIILSRYIDFPVGSS